MNLIRQSFNALQEPYAMIPSENNRMVDGREVVNVIMDTGDIGAGIPAAVENGSTVQLGDTQPFNGGDVSFVQLSIETMEFNRDDFNDPLHQRGAIDHLIINPFINVMFSPTVIRIQDMRIPSFHRFDELDAILVNTARLNEFNVSVGTNKRKTSFGEQGAKRRKTDSPNRQH